jgi:hypothetical protein
MNSSATTPDLILHHGRFTTLDRANPTASAVAIADGKFRRSVVTRKSSPWLVQ